MKRKKVLFCLGPTSKTASHESTKHSVRVLDIPDDYQFMDDELVVLIRTAAEPIIEHFNRSSSGPDKCENAT